MKVIARLLVTSMLFLEATAAIAGEALEGSLLRIDTSYNIYSTVLDDGFDEVKILESGFAGVVTYQAREGFYGQIGLGRISTDEVEINGQTFDGDDSYTVKGFGLGFRMPRATGDGLYWGLGYRNTKLDEPGSEASNSIRVFWEKEQIGRYGSIALAYTTHDDFNLISLEGRHVWFGGSGVGAGVTWGIGSGQTDTGSRPEADIGQATLGAILMFRPAM